MPGKVIAVLVKPGQEVKRGAPLMVVEEGVELLSFEAGG